MYTEEIRRRVLKVDALLDVLGKACLQDEMDSHNDVVATIKEINWEVHDLLDQVPAQKKSSRKKTDGEPHYLSLIYPENQDLS